MSFDDEATAEEFVRNETDEPHAGIAQAIRNSGGRLRDTFVERVIIEVDLEGEVIGTYEVDDLHSATEVDDRRRMSGPTVHPLTEYRSPDALLRHLIDAHGFPTVTQEIPTGDKLVDLHVKLHEIDDDT
ncbi:MAG TPA: hypothetical protein VG476_05805 [Acidimicrobiales bacterium]|nr:hypothetical protein [Acidimicrobiales bacterium]